MKGKKHSSIRLLIRKEVTTQKFLTCTRPYEKKKLIIKIINKKISYNTEILNLQTYIL